MSWLDNLFVAATEPSAVEAQRQNRDSLSAYADKMQSAGTITAQQNQDYQTQIAGTSVNQTLDNSYNLGLGGTPSQDFVASVSDSVKKLPQSLGSSLGDVVSQLTGGFLKKAWWVVVIVVVVLVGIFVWKKNLTT